MKTLKEVQNIVGLDRRAIQEYEKAKLAIKPKHTNKYGYLLYDEPEIERLWQLRFYKELGYNIPKIASIMNDKNYDMQKELEIVIVSLEEKRNNLDNMIAIAQMMKETGIGINSIRHGLFGTENLSVDVLFEVVGTAFNMSMNNLQEEFFKGEVLTEDEWDSIFDILGLILKEYDARKDASSCDVQEHIAKIHNIAKRALSESVMFLQMLLFVFTPEGDWAKECSEEIGAERFVYIYEAVQYYCESNQDNIVDNKLREAFNNIEKLGRKKYKYSAPEVQEEVKAIHELFLNINILTEVGVKGMLMHYSKLLGSDAYKKYIDNGAKRGIAWFASKAMELYCNSLDVKHEII